MAHFAKLDTDNLVLEVIVINNDVIQNLPFPESEPLGVAFCHSLYGEDTVWKQTSYNGNFRGHYAGIGYTYDSVTDEFVPPPPPPPPADISEIQSRTGILNYEHLNESELP